MNSIRRNRVDSDTLARAQAEPDRTRVVDASASADEVASRAVALLQHYLGSVA